MSELGFFSEGTRCEKELNNNVRRKEIVLVAKYALFGSLPLKGENERIGMKNVGRSYVVGHALNICATSCQITLLNVRIA